jgi:hypothetical protein
MSETEPMNVNERRKYLHKMRIRYWKAKNKSAKSVLLDEMEAVTNLHRKSLIRLIKGDLARKLRRKERGRTYGVEVQSVIEKIAPNTTIMWPTAISFSRTPQPPQATNFLQPKAIASWSKSAAIGAPTPGWKKAKR